MDRSLILQVLLLAVCLAKIHAKFINIQEQEPGWFEIGTDAVVVCEWEYETDGNTTITGEVLGWKTGATGIRKITRNDPEQSYVYKNTPIPKDRQSEETEWGELASVGRLIIHDFGIQDMNAYQCVVEANQQQESQNMNAYQYSLPTVSMRDVQISVDVRPPIFEEASNETMEANTTTSSENVPEDNDAVSDVDYPSDEPSDDEEKIIVECVIERAYPEPSRIEFVISETKHIVAEQVYINQVKDEDGKPSYYEGYARLELEPNTEYDGKEISCRVQLPVGEDGIFTKSVNVSSPIAIFHTTTRVSASISPYAVAEGKTIQIKCDGNGNPRPTFVVSPSDRVQETSNPGIFEITSVTRADAGEYSCSATVEDRSNPGEFETIEDTASLTVEYMDEPTFDVDASEITVTKGQQVTVECTGYGYPSVNVKWMHEGKKVGDSAILQLENIQYDQSGEYVCVSTSNGDLITEQTEKSLNIKVEGACQATLDAPVISSSQTKSHAYNVKLECTVTGQPSCQVSISAPENLNAEATRTKVNDGLYTLEYKELAKLPSAATFFCTASNSVGGPANASYVLDSKPVCCTPAKKGGLSTGAIIGIILLVLVVLIGIPVACYLVRRKKAEPKSKSTGDMESAEPEKEELNKGESSEDSDTGSLPPPPAETNDHRLNSAHEMTTFSTNQ